MGHAWVSRGLWVSGGWWVVAGRWLVAIPSSPLPTPPPPSPPPPPPTNQTSTHPSPQPLTIRPSSASLFPNDRGNDPAFDLLVAASSTARRIAATSLAFNPLPSADANLTLVLPAGLPAGVSAPESVEFSAPTELVLNGPLE